MFPAPEWARGRARCSPGRSQGTPSPWRAAPPGSSARPGPAPGGSRAPEAASAARPGPGCAARPRPSPRPSRRGASLAIGQPQSRGAREVRLSREFPCVCKKYGRKCGLFPRRRELGTMKVRRAGSGPPSGSGARAPPPQMALALPAEPPSGADGPWRWGWGAAAGRMGADWWWAPLPRSVLCCHRAAERRASGAAAWLGEAFSGERPLQAAAGPGREAPCARFPGQGREALPQRPQGSASDPPRQLLLLCLCLTRRARCEGLRGKGEHGFLLLAVRDRPVAAIHSVFCTIKRVVQPSAAKHSSPRLGYPSVVVTGFAGEHLCKQLGNCSFKMPRSCLQVKTDSLLQCFLRSFNQISLFVCFFFASSTSLSRLLAAKS